MKYHHPLLFWYVVRSGNDLLLRTLRSRGRSRKRMLASIRRRMLRLDDQRTLNMRPFLLYYQERSLQADSVFPGKREDEEAES